MSRTDLARLTIICALPLAIAACATPTPPPDESPVAATAATPSTPLAPSVAVASPPAPEPAPPPPTSDDAGLATMRIAFIRNTAERFDIPAADIRATLAGASIRDSIVNAMSRPAEAKPWRDYRPIFLVDARISGGRDFLATHHGALAQVEAQYGVPAEIITAIIGVETNYGGNTGSHPVVEALYTLAFAYPRTGDPDQAAREDKRELFFRDELAQLFALAGEEDLDIAALKGSYAGAMGWGQFMPSSYRKHAVDGDGDGRRDLFGNLDDVFASVANYFIERGDWQRGGPVMVRALRAEGAADFNAQDTNDPLLTQTALAALGYTPATPVPADALATVIRLDGDAGPEYWMVFHNFQAITEYNNSRLYATAVWQLSQEIAGTPVVRLESGQRPPA